MRARARMLQHTGALERGRHDMRQTPGTRAAHTHARRCSWRGTPGRIHTTPDWIIMQTSPKLVVGAWRSGDRRRHAQPAAPPRGLFTVVNEYALTLKNSGIYCIIIPYLMLCLAKTRLTIIICDMKQEYFLCALLSFSSLALLSVPCSSWCNIQADDRLTAMARFELVHHGLTGLGLPVVLLDAIRPPLVHLLAVTEVQPILPGSCCRRLGLCFGFGIVAIDANLGHCCENAANENAANSDLCLRPFYTREPAHASGVNL